MGDAAEEQAPEAVTSPKAPKPETTDSKQENGKEDAGGREKQRERSRSRSRRRHRERSRCALVKDGTRAANAAAEAGRHLIMKLHDEMAPRSHELQTSSLILCHLADCRVFLCLLSAY